MRPTSILWRRLDTPGHDACRLDQSDAGWMLSGAAVFQHDGLPAWLTYDVACDHEWRTLHAHVHGSLRSASVRFDIRRSDQGVWTMNETVAPGLEECLDLDLGFTPATNLLPLCRLGLVIGQSANAPAAWLDPATASLDLNPQRYERRSNDAWWYEAPRFDYRALLLVSPTGFVRSYPGLWQEVSRLE
jgi:hypothetical protein